MLSTLYCYNQYLKERVNLKTVEQNDIVLNEKVVLKKRNRNIIKFKKYFSKIN